MDNTTLTRYNQLLSRSNMTYKEYQYEGIKWCVNHEHNNQGGIIADEMGLGKTMTLIATIYINHKIRTLIVVPVLLLNQWIQEIYKTTGYKCVIYYGNAIKTLTIECLSKSKIVLTTYNTLLSKHSKLHDIAWNRIVYDEGHHMRNNKTQRSKACRTLRGIIKWVISGTPIQNKLKDLYTLCDIANINVRDARMHNFILRRNKTDVGLNLPNITMTRKMVHWMPNESTLSRVIHSTMDFTGINQEYSRLMKKVRGRGSHLLSILLARQSCILPLLLKERIDKLHKPDEPEETDEEEPDENINYNDCLIHSSKIDAVVSEIIIRKDNQKGKIIFCHFRREIDLLAQKLIENGITDVLTYDGRNSSDKNTDVTEKHVVLIMQIQTGCEGLNLQQHYSEVYFVSPHWNPSIEEQAIARCHRIGQINEVNVFRFYMRKLTTGKTTNIEKRIVYIQQKKLSIIKKTFL